jgi:membrane-bound inhibitor of C-type lysozyme
MAIPMESQPLYRLARLGLAMLASMWASDLSAERGFKTVVYICGSDRITVHYEGMENLAGATHARLTLPNGDSVSLPHAASASGARYSNGAVTLWEHQGTARIETPSRTWTDCRPNSN